MDPGRFFSQYFDLKIVIFGLVAVAVGIVLSARNGRKWVVRAFAVVLLAAGALMILSSIYAFGFNQAMVIAMFIVFIGSLWTIGARGIVATVLGLLAALISFSSFAYYLQGLPDGSLVKQFFIALWEKVKQLFGQ